MVLNKKLVVAWNEKLELKKPQEICAAF